MNKLQISRKSWIDIARGIGILLVLYGHVLGSDQTRFFIYAFHMPLFFFLSGMVFKEKHTESFLHFVIKNIKQILVPYFVFAAITYIYWLFVLDPSKPHNIVSDIYDIFFGNGVYPNLLFNAPLWFLPCFFVTKILYGIILRVCKRTIWRYVVLFVSGVLGAIMAYMLPNMKLFFGFEIAFTTLVFFGLGHLFIHNTHIKNLFKKKTIILFIVPLGLTYFFAWTNFHFSGHQIDTRINQYNNLFLFYAGALSGITSVIASSYLIRSNTFLEYLGKNTMTLFGWHYPIYLTIIKVIEPYWWAHDKTIKLFFPTIFTITVLCIILGCNKFVLIPLSQMTKTYRTKK